MVRKPGAPTSPPEREMTARQRIASFLKEGPCSARDLSGLVRLSEKEIYQHLPHIERSQRKEGRALVFEPPACRLCGYVFRKRRRLERPGRCPTCKGGSIDPPLFSIR